MFGTLRGIDGNVRFQFQGQTSIFNDRSSSKRDALILTADERVTQNILTTTPLENHNHVVYQKLNFVHGDAVPDTDQQLLSREDQWIFTVESEKYYLPSRKKHFPLSYFQSVMMLQKMRWSVTWSTNFVHVGIFTLNNFNHCGSPKAVFGMHPEKIG